MPHPQILFIGEAPGKEENLQGFPFVGRSGKMLNLWINEFGMKNIFGITNSVPLIPLLPNGSIRKPTDKEIEYFKPFVKHRIEKYKPKLIILLGDSACRSVLKKYISEVRNNVFYLIETPVTAVYHPSYYLRRGSNGLEDFAILYDKVIKYVIPDLKISTAQTQKINENEIKGIITNEKNNI